MINNIIKNILSKNTPPSISILYQFLVNWKEIAGEFFYKHSVPYKFFIKKSELFLACDDPTIASEIYLNQEELKKNIKQKMNFKVKTIKTTYNLQKFYSFRKVLEPEKTFTPLPKLTKKEKLKIEKITQKVNDPELKEALKIFFETITITKKLRNKKT